MATEATNNMEAQLTASPPPLPPLPEPGIFGRFFIWFREEGPWWLCSFVFHLTLVCSLALIGTKAIEAVSEAPSFEHAEVDIPHDVPQEITQFDLGETPEDPTELSTETLTLEKPAQIAQEAEYNDDSPIFEHKGGGMVSSSTQPNMGGLGGFDIKGVGAGPAFKGKGGVGVGVGTGTHPGSGGDGSGYGGRGSGSREAMIASGGGTKQSERAVAGALNWLARHQSANGSWDLQDYVGRCKSGICSGPSTVGHRPAAGTALGLLPFLAAGQTHETKGPYQKTISSGIYFLIHNQKPDGDLRMGETMYDHGLATIALCECYGMSGDKRLQKPAQAALNFIMDSQDPKGGGWRYSPRDEGDTSVVGWQIMALKSGQMAYLVVNPKTFEKSKEFLKSVAIGFHGGKFTYMPNNEVVGAGNYSTTAVGLLCHQYMNMPRTDLAMVEGTTYLMGNMPGKAENPDIYYWYYATQVMHNQPGPDWDRWNRSMRKLLIATQCKDGCAAGSWDPTAPKPDTWGSQGGRVMMTSLAALTLEVYYRYLPLYKLDKQGGGEPVEKIPQ